MTNFILERRDGGVSIISISPRALARRRENGPVETVDAAAVALANFPAGVTKVRRIDEADIPTDRTKRGEWRLSPDGGQIRDGAGVPIKDLPPGVGR